MEDVLSVVRKSLVERPPLFTLGASEGASEVDALVGMDLLYPTQDAPVLEDTTWDDGAHDDFVDTGEGAGVEGDLEMDEE